MEDNDNRNNEINYDLEINTQSVHSDISLTSKKVFVEINKMTSVFICDYAKGDTDHEMGGVLLGRYLEKDGHYRINITAAIEARHTESAKGSVKFTHETWAYINEIKEDNYPELITVGWFHTHPGFGIFLSEYDLFIHQNFFNLPWQIAYVIDPISGQHGFFGWENDKVVKVPFSAALEPCQVSSEGSQENTLKGREQKPFRFEKAASIIAMTLLILISGLFYISNQEWQEKNLQLESSIGQLESSIGQLENEINEFKKENQLLEKSNYELQASIDNIIGLTPLFEYTVAEGDTLWAISERYLGDGHLYTEIADLNKISFPDLLIPGERLLIPSGEIKNISGM